VNKTPVAEWRDGEKDFKLDWVNPAVEWQLWITNRRKQFFKVTSDNCEYFIHNFTVKLELPIYKKYEVGVNFIFFCEAELRS
jgi:hypothetical protein